MCPGTPSFDLQAHLAVIPMADLAVIPMAHLAVISRHTSLVLAQRSGCYFGLSTTAHTPLSCWDLEETAKAFSLSIPLMGLRKGQPQP